MHRLILSYFVHKWKLLIKIRRDGCWQLKSFNSIPQSLIGCYLMQFCTVECLHFITGHIPGQMSLPAQLLSVASGVGYALIDARMGTCISCLGHYFLQMLLNEERLFNFIMGHIPQVNNIYIPYPNNCLLAIYKNFQWTQQVSINLSR